MAISTEHAKKDLLEVAENIAEVAKKAKKIAKDDGKAFSEDLSDTIMDYKERAEELYNEYKDQIQNQIGNLKNKSGDLGKDISRYVRKNPNKTLMIAAAGAFLAGMLFRNR